MLRMSTTLVLIDGINKGKLRRRYSQNQWAKKESTLSLNSYEQNFNKNGQLARNGNHNPRVHIAYMTI
jgi:hypothetical protein